MNMHVDYADDTSDPRYTAARYIAQRTIELGSRPLHDRGG